MAEIQKLTLKYQKLDSYRNYLVGSVFGGITPQGKICIEICVDKYFLPSEISYEMNSDGTLGREISRDQDQSLLKQIEAGLMLDLQVAKSLKEWLDTHIAEAEKIVQR